MADVVPYAGLGIITNLLSGLGGTVPQYVSWGTGAGTSARTDTTLFTEDYSTTNNGSGNERVAGTVSRITTTETDDTVEIVGTLKNPHGTATTYTNAGVFDSIGTSGSLTTAPSGGNLLLKSDFAGVPLNPGDSMQLTFQIQFT